MATGFETGIIDIANDFYEAYLRCCEAKNPHTNEYGQSVSSYVGVPAIVNGAFACELYLKSLISKDYWKDDRHNLQALLTRLPQDKQTRIKDSVSSHLISHLYTYEEYLDALSNSFDYWRYVHEKEDFGVIGFNETIKVLPIFLDSFRALALEVNKQ